MTDIRGGARKPVSQSIRTIVIWTRDMGTATILGPPKAESARWFCTDYAGMQLLVIKAGRLTWPLWQTRGREQEAADVKITTSSREL